MAVGKGLQEPADLSLRLAEAGLDLGDIDRCRHAALEELAKLTLELFPVQHALQPLLDPFDAASSRYVVGILGEGHTVAPLATYPPQRE